MCRKQCLYGCCLMLFGLGVMVGHWLESWFLCSFGGLGLIALGFLILRRR